MSEHRATIVWVRQSNDFTYMSYNREHDWRFKGGIVVPASAAPKFRGSANCPDPEDAFVASVSSCHMLTFLAIAAKRKLVVDRYEDAAVGFLDKNAQGRFAITRIELHPTIEFAAGTAPDPATLSAMHDMAHHECFIANSVLTEIKVV
jgi:organic hydroperoxide reductase OsmC/OhrA